MSVYTETLAPLPVRRTLEYRPALDGMRGVAVAGVVAFHLGHLQGGFLGVDLFFTLSGYLITRLLLLEQESSGRIALGSFWSRRAWRLLPALYLLLACLAVYAAVFARPAELEGIRGPGVASLVFVANWWFIGTGDGYWDLFTAPSPLEHVWSLAIEQQFYVVWPLLVVVVLGRRGRLGRLLSVTLALAAASTVLLGVLATDDISRAYFGSLARSGSILVGAALAVVIHRGDEWVAAFARSRVAPWTGLAAVAMLTWFWITVNGATDVAWYRGGFLLHAAAVALIIGVLTSRPDGPATRLLSLWPIRALGVVSYGFYLWHWPVIVIVDGERTGLSGGPLLVVRLTIAMAATVASYLLLERPARQVLAKRVRALVVFPTAGAVIAVALLVATIPPATSQVIGAPPPPAATPAADAEEPRSTSPLDEQPIDSIAAGATVDVAPDPADPTAGDAGPGDPDATEVSPTTVPVAEDAPAQSLLTTVPTELPTLRTPTADDPLRVVLVGDSYMFDAAPGIVAALEASGVVDATDASRLGFRLSDGDWDATLTSIVAEHTPELVVAMWARFDARWLRDNDPAAYDERLDRAMDILTGGGAVVAFVGLAPSLSDGIDRTPIDRSINERFAAMPPRFPGQVVYVDPDPIVAPDGDPDRWLDTPQGALLVRKIDVSHYCGDGSARFGLAVAGLVRELAGVEPADPTTWWAGEWRAEPRYNDPPGACA